MSDLSLLINLSALMQQPTGISVYTRNLLTQLKTLEPVVLSSQPFPNLNSLPIPSGMSPEYGLKGHIRRLFWLQTSLPKTYQRLGSRLIFSPLPEAPIYTNCRFIVTVHDLIPLRFPRSGSPLTNYFRYVVPQIVKQAVHIICDSNSTACDLEQFYKINRNKITTIPLAYDQENFNFREQYSNQSAERYFIYIGRQDAYKNLDRLLDAFARVGPKTDTQLWFVGPQDKRYTPQLMTQVRELDLESRVRFLDYVAYADLPKLLGDALALTFPSLWEGFGLPALESMACGTPVIASNLSSLPEVVGDAAVLIDPYNVDELADAMKTLARDVQFRQALRLKGLEQAHCFSWKKTGQQTVDVLKQFV
ncbi:glycosyltransferase [Leptolyngbya sp. PCC 7375]|nr:glycosyltransferase [Leptolyngbya sp. PCC 7375]